MARGVVNRPDGGGSLRASRETVMPSGDRIFPQGAASRLPGGASAAAVSS